ncbi:DUF6932 family protein [Brevundimonas diminuta]|uniref:DUF6932 family protein n=1 Tax=Brevundimonas diminuta TaxID=293 RepID=UPI003D9A413F
MALKFGSVSGLLPKGEHPVTWDEVVQLCGFSHRRRELLQGLLRGAYALREAGVRELFIDGSFSTKKHNPTDYDCCYDTNDVNYDLLDPVLDDFENERARMKEKYHGEFLPAYAAANWPEREPYRTFFQHEKNGRPKGILVLDLATLP